MMNHFLMNRTTIFFISGFFIVGLIATVVFYLSVMDISVPYSIVAGELPDQGKNKEVVYIGVISRYPPNVILNGYQPIMDYLNRTTKYRFELKLSTNYEQTLKQLVKGEVTAAFFGSYLYVKSRQQYNLKPILKPLNENGHPFFKSALIVPNNSKIKTVDELRGKRIALPSPESFSGNWLISLELPRYGIHLKDLNEVQNFAHHHSVVYQVLKGNYDAGVVRDYLARQYEHRGIKIIAYSEPIPGSPIVISSQSKVEHVAALKTALLSINPDDAGNRAFLQLWDKEFIHGFVTASDSDYNFISSLLSHGGGK